MKYIIAFELNVDEEKYKQDRQPHDTDPESVRRMIGNEVAADCQSGGNVERRIEREFAPYGRVTMLPVAPGEAAGAEQ